METRTALPVSAPELTAALAEARRRTLALVDDLDDEQLLGPQLAIVNPLLWEIGHVAWLGPAALRPPGDPGLYAAVGALAGGDTPQGLRQMTGNVWEWTATDFGPYPGFVADPYKDYSEPWFGDHKVLRGGCWATGARASSGD